jgi:hypothetical protein
MIEPFSYCRATTSKNRFACSRPKGQRRVALDDHRLHVVVQHLLRHAAERQERPLVAADRRLHALVVAELDVARPAPRLHPRVAMNTFSLSAPRPTVAQSARICWPGSVSKRTIGGDGGIGARPPTNCFSHVSPPV